MSSHRCSYILCIIQTTHGFVIIVWVHTNPPRNIGEGFELSKSLC
jgi:hypothetical protein